MLKINGNNISEIKFNGNNILLAKINDNIVFNNSGSILLYKFGLLSDIHIDGDGTDTYNTITKFQNAINYYKNNADFVCITGDVSYDGRESDFVNYQTIIGDFDVKTISGNHDASSFNLYNQYTGDSLYYEYTIQNDVFLFVGADSTFSYTKPLTDEEFTWLKTKLEEYKNKRVFVMFHFFINPVGNANNLAKTDIFDTTSTQGQEFVSLLSTYKNIILCTGHSHLEFGMEKYEETANYIPKGNTCARIHTPSLGYPKTNNTGTSNADTYSLTDVGFGYLIEVYSDKTKFRAIKFGLSSYSMLNDYVYEIPVETSQEEVIPSTISTEWLDYNNPHFEGNSRAYNSLNTWIYNTSGTAINGVYLDLVTEKPCEFKMTADYHSYKGGPTKYCVFILDSDNNDVIVNRYDYEFDNNGTLTTRELTVNLDMDKNYKVVIGSDKGFEFGVKITQISLTELLSN